MTRPASTDRGVAFDLASIDREMRAEPAYQRTGHVARTLVREADLRIVMIVIKAGARIAEHKARETASLQGLLGHVRVRLPDKTLDLTTGQLIVLEPGLPHDVEAAVDSAFLQTLAWPARADRGDRDDRTDRADRAPQG